MLCFRLIDESLRWLVANHRNSHAEQLILKIGTQNKVDQKLIEEAINSLTISTTQPLLTSVHEDKELVPEYMEKPTLALVHNNKKFNPKQSSGMKKDSRFGPLNILRHAHLRKITFVLFICRLVLIFEIF